MSLGTPRSAGENFGWTWEPLGVRATSQGVPTTSLRAPMTTLAAPITNLRAPVTSLRAPRITVERSGKNNIFFANAAGAPGNHSYYLSFNNG